MVNDKPNISTGHSGKSSPPRKIGNTVDPKNTAEKLLFSEDNALKLE